MQTCVVDACSLLHSFHIELGSRRLSELLARHFRIVLDQSVAREIPPAFDRAYTRWRNLGLVNEDRSEIKAEHARWIATECDSSGDPDRTWLNSENLSHLDAGEIGCIALARHSAEELTAYVVMLTDDYEAARAAEQIFDMYQCGMVIGSADIIVFFGMRLNLPRAEIHLALRTLISFYSDKYNELLRERETVLGRGPMSYVVSLIQHSQFESAKREIMRGNLPNATRKRLLELIGQITTIADSASTLGRCIGRIRALAKARIS